VNLLDDFNIQVTCILETFSPTSHYKSTFDSTLQKHGTTSSQGQSTTLQMHFTTNTTNCHFTSTFNSTLQKHGTTSSQGQSTTLPAHYAYTIITSLLQN
jgi:hypothetical protein